MGQSHTATAAAIPEPAPATACSRCDAVCCRLTVVLMPEDRIPGHLTEYNDDGLHVMARNEEGWCVAVDNLHLRCTIYEQRPAICRQFAMGGPYCREVRNEYLDQMQRGVPLTQYR